MQRGTRLESEREKRWLAVARVSARVGGARASSLFRCAARGNWFGNDMAPFLSIFYKGRYIYTYL